MDEKLKKLQDAYVAINKSAVEGIIDSASTKKTPNLRQLNLREPLADDDDILFSDEEVLFNFKTHKFVIEGDPISGERIVEILYDRIDYFMKNIRDWLTILPLIELKGYEDDKEDE